jgi:hypothetical protein
MGKLTSQRGCVVLVDWAVFVLSFSAASRRLGGCERVSTAWRCTNIRLTDLKRCRVCMVTKLTKCLWFDVLKLVLADEG